MRNPKFQVAPEWIKNHYLPEDRLCVAMIKRDGESTQIQQEFKSALQISSDAYQKHLRAANANGADIYVSANALRDGAMSRTKADVEEVRHLYLDVDSGGKAAVEKILAADGMPRPHVVIETSPDKHQLFWQVEQFKLEEAEQWMRGMARQYEADPAATDSARVLRVPGFRNCKYQETHYVRDVTEQFGARAEKIYQPEDFPAPKLDKALPAVPQFGQKVAVSRSGDGTNQSKLDYAYALRSLERGQDRSVIVQKIADYRRPDGKHPDVQDYAERTVRAAYAKHVSRPSAPAQKYAESERGR